MTLLDQEVKKEELKGKKIVLMLLILSIILLIFAIVAMVALGGKQTKPLTLSVNGNNIKIENDLLITDENGVNYISLPQIAKFQIGYEYIRGGYLEYTESETKGYLESTNQIIQFEANNNIIYKTKPDTYVDYEEFKLQNNILQVNNALYIAIDDLNIGLNIVYTYSEKDNKISLNTADNLVKSYQASLTETSQVKAISDEFNNEKAVCYNMLVVSNENEKWGVVDTNFSSIITNKYSSIEFIESAGVFIVSDNGKYGVISKEPNKKPILDLNYEEVNIINNSPLFYQVKLAGKYGIINEEGKPVINNIYESMGYNTEATTEQSVLVIKDFGKDKANALVVCNGGKYGLVNLDNGSTIINCILDKIYAKNENGEKKYYIQFQEQEQQQEMELNEYIERINTTNINIG